MFFENYMHGYHGRSKSKFMPNLTLYSFASNKGPIHGSRAANATLVVTGSRPTTHPSAVVFHGFISRLQRGGTLNYLRSLGGIPWWPVMSAVTIGVLWNCLVNKMGQRWDNYAEQYRPHTRHTQQVLASFFMAAWPPRKTICANYTTCLIRTACHQVRIPCYIRLLLFAVRPFPCIRPCF